MRKGGTISVVGAYGPLFSAVKFGDAMNKGLTLRMNQCPVKRQWPRLFEHVRNGYLKPSDIVTHRIPLEHIAEGYHIFSAKLDGCIKPLVVPQRRLTRRTDHGRTPPRSRRSPESSEQLRARIPGWGVDLDPADRPSVPESCSIGRTTTGRPLGVPRAAAREVAARALDRAQVPDPGVRHGLPAARAFRA